MESLAARQAQRLEHAELARTQDGFPLPQVIAHDTDLPNANVLVLQQVLADATADASKPAAVLDAEKVAVTGTQAVIPVTGQAVGDPDTTGEVSNASATDSSAETADKVDAGEAVVAGAASDDTADPNPFATTPATKTKAK